MQFAFSFADPANQFLSLIEKKRGFKAIDAYMQCLPHLLDVSLDSLDGNCVIWNKWSNYPF